MRTSAAALGGVSAATLAATYGTPLLVIDTDVLDAAIKRFTAAAASASVEICYAAKALFFVALAERIGRSGLGIDVCSLGELLTAERAGIAPARLVLHGCGKTDAELAAAAAGRVGRVVVDQYGELVRLARTATAERPVSVLLRLNTGIAVNTHAYVRTGGDDSKFGFAPDDLAEAVALAVGTPALRLRGVHSHLGSQIFDGAAYAASAAIVMDAYGRMATAGAPVGEVIVGGGFGVAAEPGSGNLDVAPVLEAVAATVRAAADARRLPVPRIGIEPGRSIVAEAGTSLYRVIARKDQGRRRFVIVDGGIADNPRPALYGAFHRPFLANRDGSSETREVTVCGRSCENDQLVVARLPNDLAEGDLLGLETTGAYTYSMASNYNRFPKPAVVFCGAGAHRLVVRRERDDDTLRNDVID